MFVSLNMPSKRKDRAVNDQSNTQPKPFDVAKRVKFIREIEAKLKEMKKEFTEKCKPYQEASETLRNEILDFLNSTGQENSRTEYGTPYKYKDVSWRITDLSAFQRHVIGTEDWDLLAWHASKTVCDAQFESTKQEPPGTKREVTIKLGVKPPVKKRVKPARTEQTLTDEEWDKLELEVDKELEQDNSQE